MDVKEVIEMRAQLEHDICTELCHYIQSFEGATEVAVSSIDVNFMDVSTALNKRFAISHVTVKLEIE